MYKLLITLVLSFISLVSQAQLDIYPALPGNKLMSQKYRINVKQSGDYVSSYVYEYLKNNGNDATNNDPYNISNSGKVNALTDGNHWTCFSFGGDEVTIEVELIGGSISDCKVFPSRYALNATYADGKAYITVAEPNKKMYLEVNGNIKEPLFVFADALETNVPDGSSSTVKYFGPGIHNIGENYTPASTIRTVYIAGGAYVIGNIYTKNRDNLEIRGRGIISGEGIKFRFNGGVSAHIYFDGSSDNCKIEGITIIKPTHYHVLSRGQFDVDNIKCISWNNTTDGWGGGYGSGNPCTCTNSFFKVNDDVFKIYGDNFVIHDCVVYQQTNGHVFQFGWGGQKARNAKVNRIDIVRSSETEPSYPTNEGHPIIGWASANSGTYQTGHVFNDVVVDNGISKIFGISSGGTTNITLNDFKISHTVKKSELPSSNVNIKLNCVTLNDACVTAAEFNNSNGLTIDCSDCFVPVKNIMAAKDFAIYPNPCNSVLHIESKVQGNTLAYMYQADGKLLNQFQLTKGENRIPVENLNKGMYLLKIMSPDGISTHKILVEKE